MGTMRPYGDGDVERIEKAYALLGRARDLLKTADCPKTLHRVRLALTSAGGALRHVRHRRMAASQVVGKELF